MKTYLLTVVTAFTGLCIGNFIYSMTVSHDFWEAAERSWFQLLAILLTPLVYRSLSK